MVVLLLFNLHRKISFCLVNFVSVRLMLLVQGEVFLPFVLGLSLFLGEFYLTLAFDYIQRRLNFIVQTRLSLIKRVLQLALSLHRQLCPFL